jgi:hypothetical protein
MRSAYLTPIVDNTDEAERIYCRAFRRRADLRADERNFFRLPFCPAQGQVRDILGDPPRASQDIETPR